jgi:GYF domain 2
MAEFWVVRDGERIGPFAEAEILRSYESGALQDADLLWSPGMASGATVAEAFAEMRKSILTRSQPLALEEIAPPAEPSVRDHAPPPADVAVPAERPRTAPKRGGLVALAVLIALALAFAAFHFLA